MTAEPYDPSEFIAELRRFLNPPWYIRWWRQARKAFWAVWYWRRNRRIDRAVRNYKPFKPGDVVEVTFGDGKTEERVVKSWKDGVVEFEERAE